MDSMSAPMRTNVGEVIAAAYVRAATNVAVATVPAARSCDRNLTFNSRKAYCVPLSSSTRRAGTDLGGP